MNCNLQIAQQKSISKCSNMYTKLHIIPSSSFLIMFKRLPAYHYFAKRSQERKHHNRMPIWLLKCMVYFILLSADCTLRNSQYSSNNCFLEAQSTAHVIALNRLRELKYYIILSR